MSFQAFQKSLAGHSLGQLLPLLLQSQQKLLPHCHILLSFPTHHPKNPRPHHQQTLLSPPTFSGYFLHWMNGSDNNYQEA